MILWLTRNWKFVAGAVALFAIAASIIGYGHLRFNAGQADIRSKWEAQKEKDAAELAKLKAKSSEVTVRVETKYVDRIKEIRVKGDTIVKKVPIYVPAGLPDLPPGWRLLHDHAAAGTVPGSSENANGAPVAPEVAAVAVADNYATCLANTQQLRGLQEWVNEQKRLNP